MKPRDVKKTYNPLFGCLNGVKMWNTLLRMTLPEHFRDSMPCYNPEVVLRILVNILKPGEQSVSCRRFIHENGLAFAFVSTSFESPDLRLYGYTVLQRFYALLKRTDEEFAPKPLFLFLITLFRQSITINNQRVCHVITHFFARVSKLMLNPLDHVYPAVMSFLALKPILNLTSVPEFLKMFFSSSTQHFARERIWMIRLCSWSVVDPHDYQVISASFVVESCQAAFLASFADAETRREIIGLFANCLRLQSAAYEFLNRFNFLSWVACAVECAPVDLVEELMLTDVFLICVHQLHNIHCSKSQKEESAVDEAEESSLVKRKGCGETDDTEKKESADCSTVWAVKNALIKMSVRRIAKRLRKNDDARHRWRADALEAIAADGWDFVTCEVGGGTMEEKFFAVATLAQQCNANKMRPNRIGGKEAEREAVANGDDDDNETVVTTGEGRRKRRRARQPKATEFFFNKKRKLTMENDNGGVPPTVAA